MPSSPRKQNDWILRTKLHRPQLPPDLVPRARLLELLDQNPGRSFTLVSAPAGYGKSTLVSRWLDGSGGDSVWLSLDEEDNDLRGFLKYFIAAVRTHSSKACRRSHEFLEAAELPPPAVLSEYLGNDLDAIKRRFVLVLDDYHRVRESAIHELVGQLLRHPSRTVHLVLVTRRDPPMELAGMRARGRSLEVRERDLRFTRDETRTVLETIGGVSVSDAVLESVHAGLEGWITGLRLVCLMLRHQADPEEFLSRLDGAMPSLQEYLVEEVLKQLPPSFEQCLVKTSILNRFCGPLCEALCGGDGGHAADGPFTGEEFLHDLDKANLFAIRLDDGGRWFRYHHLFQQMLRRLLRQRVPVEEVRALHGRASRWFASQGLIDEALEHALAAGETGSAAEIVESQRVGILNADRWPVLAGWLSQLPEEEVWRRPELLLGEAWLAYYRFRIPELARIVERLDGLLAEGPSRPAWLGELSMFKSYLFYWQGRTAEMLEQVGQARELLPATHDLMRADSEIYFGLAHHMAGEEEPAIAELTMRIREQPGAKGLMITRQVITLAFIHLLAGRLKETAVYSRQLEELARTNSPVYISSWSTYLLGCCHFHAGEWDEAVRCFRWIAENRYVSHTATVMSSLIGLAVSLQFLGRDEEAGRIVKLASDYAVESKDPGNLLLAESGRVRVGLLQGTVERLALPPESAGMATAFLFIEVPEITCCRALVAGGVGEELAQALGMIDALVQEAEAIHNVNQRIDLMVLKAVACRKLGRTDEANDALARAVELATPGRWVRPFVEAGEPMRELIDQARRPAPCGAAASPQSVSLRSAADFGLRIADWLGDQLGAVPRSAPRKPQPLIESLTNRELDVLECLAERLYDKEIAEKLSVSTSTVKTHLRHIYEKLAVGGRRDAVVKAEELGMLAGDGRERS